jgi:MSHA pilin protein MshC
VFASEAQQRILKLGALTAWALPSSFRAHQSLRDRGFTVVELIVVITILGIMAAFAAPRFTNNQAFSDRGYFEEVTNGLRLAQKLAVGTGCPVRFLLNSSGYAAAQQAAVGNRCDVNDTSWSSTILLPDGRALQGVAPAGTTTTPTITIVFNGLGATNLGANQTITIGGLNLVVHAASGYIDVP